MRTPFCLCCIITLCAIYANGFTAELTEQQFINLVLKKQNLLEKAILKLKIKHLERDGSKADYSALKWDVGAAFGEKRRKTSKDTDSTFTKKHKSHIREISTKLSKKFFRTGAEISLNASRNMPRKLDEKYQEQIFNDYDYLSEQRNSLSLDFKVALLKNRKGVQDSKTYDIDVLDVNDEKHVIQAEQSKIIYTHLKLFLDWAYYHAQIPIHQQHIALTKNTLQKAKGKSETKSTLLLLKSAITKSQQALLSSQNRIQAIQKKLATSLRDKYILQRAPKVQWHRKPYFVKSPRQYLAQHSSPLQRIKVEQQINKRNTKSYRNARLPDLDLVLRAEKSNNKGNYSNHSYQKDTEYEARLELSYPLLGNTKNKTNLAKARIKKRLLRIKYNDTLRDLLSDIEKITTDLTLGEKELSSYKKEVLDAKKDAQNEMQNYDDDAINVRFLKKAQKEWLDSQLNHLKAKWEYRKSAIRYEYLFDRLIPK